jgi:hypothetical protein
MSLVEVDLINKYVCRSLLKKKYFYYHSIMKDTKSKEHIYKNNHVNQLTMIFQKHNLKKHDIILEYEKIMQGFQNMKNGRRQFMNKLTLSMTKYIVSYICMFQIIIKFC